MKNLNRWLLVALGLGILLVFGVLAVMLFAPPSPGENALPTLVVLNTAIPTENIPTLENTATNEALPTEETTTTVETLLSPTTAASSTEALLLATDTATTVPSATTAASPTNTVAAVAPQASATGGLIVISTQAPAQTLAPTVSPQASSTPVPVTTLDATGLVIFNQPTNIGVGELRVLSMTAPADEVMISLGEGIPAIQPNQQWVLVELFLICPNTRNCAPTINSFSLQSSANMYQPTPLAIESAFGSLLLDNQVLGHIAYVIPRNESPFALELNLGGQVYRFALQ
jgi:hypothetical protein